MQHSKARVSKTIARRLPLVARRKPAVPSAILSRRLNLPTSIPTLLGGTGAADERALESTTRRPFEDDYL